MSHIEVLEEKIDEIEEHLAVMCAAIAGVRKSLLHLRKIELQNATTRFVNPALERKAKL